MLFSYYYIQGLSKMILQSLEIDNQEGLAAFEFCVERDHCCFMKPHGAAHSAKRIKVRNTKYSIVCYVAWYQEGLTSFQFCMETDHCCFMTLQPVVEHSLRTTELKRHKIQ
jgi:hypothetical protein